MMKMEEQERRKERENGGKEKRVCECPEEGRGNKRKDIR